jgi:hypothetical protein
VLEEVASGRLSLPLHTLFVVPARVPHYHLIRAVPENRGTRVALDRVYSDANAARSAFMEEVGTWALFGARVAANGEQWYAEEVLWAEMALDAERRSAFAQIAGTAATIGFEVGSMRIAVEVCRRDCQPSA